MKRFVCERAMFHGNLRGPLCQCHVSPQRKEALLRNYWPPSYPNNTLQVITKALFPEGGIGGVRPLDSFCCWKLKLVLPESPLLKHIGNFWDVYQPSGNWNSSSKGFRLFFAGNVDLVGMSIAEAIAHPKRGSFNQKISPFFFRGS